MLLGRIQLIQESMRKLHQKTMNAVLCLSPINSTDVFTPSCVYKYTYIQTSNTKLEGKHFFSQSSPL